MLTEREKWLVLQGYTNGYSQWCNDIGAELTFCDDVLTKGQLWLDSSAADAVIVEDVLVKEAPADTTNARIKELEEKVKTLFITDTVITCLCGQELDIPGGLSDERAEKAEADNERLRKVLGNIAEPIDDIPTLVGDYDSAEDAIIGLCRYAANALKVNP